MASGLSDSDMATEGGCGLNVAVGGGAGRGRASVRSTGASWAAEAVGVRGDTGGRSGVGDFERLPEWCEPVEASLDEGGRALVSTRSAGMAAGGRGARMFSRAQGRSAGDDSTVLYWRTAAAAGGQWAKVRSDHVEAWGSGC